MYVHLPWIQSRKRLFFALLVDALLLAFFAFSGFFSAVSRHFWGPLFTCLVVATWLLVSYVVGRYQAPSVPFVNHLVYLLLRTFIVVSITLLVIISHVVKLH